MKLIVFERGSEQLIINKSILFMKKKVKNNFNII